jgi:hypothetical protein
MRCPTGSGRLDALPVSMRRPCAGYATASAASSSTKARSSRPKLASVRDPATTLRHYSHAVARHDEDVADELDALPSARRSGRRRAATQWRGTSSTGDRAPRRRRLRLTISPPACSRRWSQSDVWMPGAIASASLSRAPNSRAILTARAPRSPSVRRCCWPGDVGVTVDQEQVLTDVGAI